MLALVPIDKKNIAQGLAKEILGHLQKTQPPGGSGDLTLSSLRKVVAEEVRAALGGAQRAPQARSWATVAAGALGPAQAEPQSLPKKVIPQRITREILVRGNSLPASLAKRSPQEIVQAINQASTRKGAIAARKLPSGDTIVTFQDAPTKEWHTCNNQWIQQAFGEQAKEAYRTFAVLVKGLRKEDLQGVTEETLGKELGLQSIDKVKIRLPGSPGATRATALVTFTS